MCFYGDLFRREPGSEIRSVVSGRIASRDRRFAVQPHRWGCDQGTEPGGGGCCLRADHRHGDDHGHRNRSPVDDGEADRVRPSTATPECWWPIRWARCCPTWRCATTPDEVSVDTFVTLGSPLASPMMVDQIGASLHDSYGAWPGVRRWSTSGPSRTWPALSR